MTDNIQTQEYKYDFDDILIVPSTITDITSRYNDIELPNKLPLFTAPMDTVVNETNYNQFLHNRIRVTLPRTVNYNNLKNNVNTLPKPSDNVFFSFGFDDLDELKKDNYDQLYYQANILIDVANGHMKKILHYCKEIVELRPDINIMVGNIANPKTYKLYAKSGLVDYIRVGIGNGGGCLTTKQSGVGYPMASLIREIRDVKESLSNYNTDLKLPAIVADGGMKDYSDIVKALALGADYVMLGSIFNRALESAGDNYYNNKKIDIGKAKYLFFKGKKIEKYFRGMSTKSAQKAMGRMKIKTSEGIEQFKPVEYTLGKWIENFEHYLRNAMSYSNAKTLDNFIGNTSICKITRNAYDRFNK